MKYVVLVILAAMVAALVYLSNQRVPDFTPKPLATSRPSPPIPELPSPGSAPAPSPPPPSPSAPTAAAPAAPANEERKSEEVFVVNGKARPLPFKLNTETGPPATAPTYPVDGQIGERIPEPADPNTPPVRR